MVFRCFQKDGSGCSFFVGRTSRIDSIFHDIFGFLQQGRMAWKHFLDYQETLKNSVLRTISDEILFTCFHSLYEHVLLGDPPGFQSQISFFLDPWLNLHNPGLNFLGPPTDHLHELTI